MRKQLIGMSFIGLFFCANLFAQDSAKSIEDSIKVLKPQEEKNNKVQVNLYGFIRSDFFYDTRQNIGAGENVVMLYPKDRQLDANGKDVNSARKFHMLSIISRVGLNLKGPDILGAKTAGILEGEYFGATEGGINEFRLRHAYVTLDWEKTQIGFGQFWHPFVVTDALPNTVNYGTGAPVYALNRVPQVRLTQKLANNLKVIAAVSSQRDFTPNTEPYRNGLPSVNLQLQYKTSNFVAGIGAQYENLKPKLISEDLKSNERVKSLSALAYLKWITKPLTITTTGYLMQNASSLVALGGYIGYQKPGEVEVYKTMNTQSIWLDLQQNSLGKWSAGLFTGIVYNRGVKDPIEGAKATTYGVTSNWGAISAADGGRTVNYLYKIIPRVDFTPNKALKFRLELENNTAQWADATNKGTGNSNKFLATNNRLHLTTTFNF